MEVLNCGGEILSICREKVDSLNIPEQPQSHMAVFSNAGKKKSVAWFGFGGESVD